MELFGGPTVRMSGHEVSLSPYQACLVGVVFARPEAGVGRSPLLHLLWEEDGPQARHRLSQLLYSVSQKPGGERLFDAGPDRIAPGVPEAAADLRRFEELLEDREYGAAADLLERRFLSALPDPPTRAFEEWLERERARLRAAVRRPVANRWSELAEAEAWAPAARLASVLLRLDPYDERILRQVLWSRGMAGRVQEALAEYRSFRERREAAPERDSWRPTPETAEIVERLEALDTTPGPPPEVSRREPEGEPTLCGRDRELATLSRAVASGGGTDLTTVVLTGEAGIGKTRLAEEAIRGARLRGYRVLRAGSSEFERDIPLNLLLEALDHDGTGPALNRLDDPWRSVLLSLMPQFHRGDGPLPEIPWVEPKSLPRRTYEALRRLMGSVASEGPVLLFLDDFQWADETSVAAVEFLRRRWSGGRLVLILALRGPGRIRKSRPEEFVEELLAGGDAVHVHLDELEQEAAERLIGEVAHRALGPEERREIAALAGRNPFFTVELTHEFLEGHLEIRVEPGEVLPVPVSIRQLLERRLEELSSPERQILAALAVYGRQASLEDVASLVDQPSMAECAARIDHLQELRLIRWVGRRVVVRHELIRHTVHGSLSGGSRSLHHERVARWLEERGDGSPDELALHFDRAGLEEEALHYSLEAADHAEASGAVPEAVRFLTTARRNTDDPAEAARIVGRLGHLHYLHRNFTEAAPLLDIAAERYRKQGKVTDALTAEVERVDALSRLELIPVQDFVQKTAEMKEEARERGEWETLAKLLDVEVHTLDREGDSEGVRRVLAEAEGMAEKGSPAARCAARCTLAINVAYGSPAAALDAAREAYQIAHHNKLEHHLLVACNRLIVNLVHLGIFGTEEGRNVTAVAEKLAQRSGDRQLRFVVPANQGVWYLDIGLYDRARHFFAKAENIVREHPAPQLDAILQVNLGELDFIERYIDDALKRFEAVTRLRTEGAGIHVSEVGRAGTGLCALFKGKYTTAKHTVEMLRPEPDEWVYDRYLIVRFKAELLKKQGKVSEAISLLKNSSETCQDRFIPSWLKLKLQEVRISKDVDAETARRTAIKGYKVAQKYGLGKRQKQFEGLYNALNET